MLQNAMKIILRLLVALLLLIIVVVALLYIPPIQNWIKDLALERVNETMGMTIEVDDLNIGFPADVDVTGVRVIDANGDTMVRAQNLSANVSLAPLFKGEVEISDISLTDAYYKMGTPDSIMYMRAGLQQTEIDELALSLKQSEINIGDTRINGVKLRLSLKADSTESAADTTASIPWNILARKVSLKDVDYAMAMEAVADTIAVYIGTAQLLDGTVDMSSKLPAIRAKSFKLSETEAKYLVDASIAPQEGLDLNRIVVSDVSIDLDSIYNQGPNIDVPIRRLHAVEQCGIVLDAAGRCVMDSVSMKISDLDVATLFSQIKIDGELGLTQDDAPLRLFANARVGLADIETLYPSLKPMLREVPRYNDLIIKSDIDGRMSAISLNEMSVELPRYMSVAIDGEVKNVTTPARLSGNLNLQGSLNNVNFIKPTVIDARLKERINVPPMTLDGNVAMSKGEIAGTMKAITHEGQLALDALWKGQGEEYDLTLDVDSFPVTAFFPELGLSELCAKVKANGKGFDVFSPATKIDGDITLRHMLYNGRKYGNARAWTKLAEGNINAGIVSLNDNADFDFEVLGSIAENKDITWAVEGDVRNFDLRSLGLSPERSRGELSINGQGEVLMGGTHYRGHINVGNLEWQLGEMFVSTSSIDFEAEANDSFMTAELRNNDLLAHFDAKCGIDTFVERILASSTELEGQITNRRVDVERLQGLLPRFALDVKAGGNNVINSVLSSSDMAIRGIAMSMSNDSLIDLQGAVDGLKVGESRMDSITFSALQHSRYLIYNVNMDNRQGTMDKFAHVWLSGYLADDKVSAFVKQRNIAGKEGFNFGVVSSIGDSVVSMRFSPLTPTIGYKNWTINSDNFITYNVYTHHFDADLRMQSDESHIQLYTEHDDATHHQEEVVLNVANLKISELLAVSPYAPPMKGALSADMRFGWNENSLDGKGLVSINEMFYGRDRVGSFDLGIDLTTSRTGVVNASTSLMIDSIKTITAVGTLNDSTSANPFNLDFRMIHFPLRVLNPFIPDRAVAFTGQLNGQMDITGELSSPRFDGYVKFDTTSVKVKMIGSSFTFSPDMIPVKDNRVTFTDYEIFGANENALKIGGFVDMTKIVSPQIDLTFDAKNMQFMNSNKGKGADVYGKGFANVNASVKGDMSALGIDASLTLLGGSNITYIMTDAASTISSQNTGEMVKFVQFADTFNIDKNDTITTSAMAINLDARLRISGGTTINVDLSPDAKNRVQLQGSGNFNYTMNSMDDSRFTGRYTLDKGFVRYTPPLMSEKLFNFQEGSYVAFNGDMLNPILNIHAVDQVKANVTREGQDSRLVNFDVSLAVTNTMNNMNVEFDLSTTDDITIQNELQSMSAEQRANQAMNMLLYNVYTGPGSTGSMASNPLYSFLESQINTWAANNIKFVDISFGIDQYDKTQDGATSSAVNYSYRVSKTLFNDRFKIVVGGNYSTDADADEDVTQSLINDISFEYMLNRSGSMYVKIFRHVGYESILEGEVTQTGVGFVYKRKLQTLRDLFRFGRRHKSVNEPSDTLSKTANDSIK